MPASGRKTKSLATRQRRVAASASIDEGGPSGLLTVVAVALLAARFLLPTEASVDGETLWLTQCWLGAGLLWVWDRYRAGWPLVTWDSLTCAVLLLAAGHIVSGVGVLMEGGEKRAAINMMWEWMGLAVTFLVVRTVVPRGRPDGARLVWSLTVLAGALAGLGLYQHNVWYPQVRKQYAGVREELDELLAAGRSGTATEILHRQQRVRELQQAMKEYGVPADDVGRRLWEQRLYSDEPFGTFALANTLAGLLAAFLFPAAALLVVQIRNRGNWKTLLGPALVVLLLVWCLLLTKSRTAWVGTLAGVAVWWLLRRRAASARRRWIGLVLAAVLLLGAIVAAAAATGGIDAKVLSEAPKSLRYRVEYWRGTAGVLREFPLLGPGPGNFRQYYLKHKLPESSEEIRDPHNLFLDAWCGGGLPALAGLLMLLGIVVLAVLRHRETEQVEAPSPTGASVGLWAAGLVAGFLLTMGAGWFIGQGDPLRSLSLLAGSAVLMAATWPAARRSTATVPFVAAGLAALVVHLLGAGGMEMPAIAQILVVFSIILAAGRRSREDPERHRQADRAGRKPRSAPADGGHPSPLSYLFAATMFVVLFGACLATATLPVLKRNWLLAAGDSARSVQEAGRYYRAAAVADPFSPEPVSRLAFATYSQWKADPRNTQLLDRAIEQQRVAIATDPDHFQPYWTLAEWLFERSRTLPAPRALQARKEAFQAFADALERYPHNVRLLADFARTLAEAGDASRPAAARIAQRALEQDALNRREGHADKYLDDAVLRRLRQIAGKDAG